MMLEMSAIWPFLICPIYWRSHHQNSLVPIVPIAYLLGWKIDQRILKFDNMKMLNKFERNPLSITLTKNRKKMSKFANENSNLLIFPELCRNWLKFEHKVGISITWSYDPIIVSYALNWFCISWLKTPESNVLISVDNFKGISCNTYFFTERIFRT